MGDFRPDKGPLESIRCAKTAGIQIRLAGPESRYFHEVIKPEIDGINVEYVGEVDHAGKVSLLSGALAMLFPVKGLEACPLVLLESMACGTPILAIGRGPVPEIVTQGVSGIYIDEFTDLPNQLKWINELDRSVIRQIAVERFDVSRMVDDYLHIFNSIA
jgi:glycosyltransferase involved in cell wall biosynthesis